MGTFKGHAIPGMEFVLLGLFLNLIYKAEQYVEETKKEVECNYKSVGMKVSSSENDQDPEEGRSKIALSDNTGSTARIKMLFSLYTITSIALGILYEGFGGVWKGGGFLMEKGHLTMYCGFLPAAIAFGLESGLFPGSKIHHVENAPLLSQGAFTMAFFNQYLILNGHAHMKKPGPDTLFHQLWANSVFYLFLVYLSSCMCLLVGQRKLARIIQLSQPAFLYLQGFWTIIIGAIMFPKFGEMHDDIELETVQSLFGMCIITLSCLQYVWIELIPPSFASCYQRLAAR